MVEQALRLLEQYHRNGTVSAATTATRILDGLGLTQKGKRDLRLLVVSAPAPEPERELSEIEERRAARDARLGRARG